jgi:heparin binding hemagglutinin HbhA
LLVISGAWEQFESSRPPKQVSERHARPGRSTTPAKKAPAKKAPAKKVAAGKAAAKQVPAGDSQAEAES